MYIVYILHSSSLNQYYTGQTNDLEARLGRHNKGLVKSTKRGIPWILVHKIEVDSRSESLVLEKKIKKRGAKRFLQEIGM